MNEIVWSPLAQETYLATIDQLLQRWGLDISLEIDSKVSRLLKQLERHKWLCPPSQNMPSLRRCTITKYTSLTYRVAGNQIEIVLFFDTRSEHFF